MKTRSFILGILLLIPFLEATPQTNKATKNPVSEIIINKLSSDITLTDAQKDSINVLFNRTQIKARTADVKDSVFAKEIKISRQIVMDSILTPEQKQIIKSKNNERQQAFIEKVNADYNRQSKK